MKLEEYIKRYNYAPILQYEFAQGASELIDADELKFAAQLYLHAMQNFKDKLSEYGIEEG